MTSIGPKPPSGQAADWIWLPALPVPAEVANLGLENVADRNAEGQDCQTQQVHQFDRSREVSFGHGL
ncbi:MAG: hypothetical protein NZ899_06075 [Thermoguttaceae bacterium]|nr:hypothetical protein [Thermoguttaceae bacterium]